MFSQEKATAATAFMLRLGGQRMSYLKLIKLLYLGDREALCRWGFNITTDRYVAMSHGPVVSGIYDLMVSDESEHEFWSQYITPPIGYDLELKEPGRVPNGQLSRSEETLLAEIFAQYGSWDKWRLRDFTHTLPEWHDPGATSVPISVRQILRAQGVPEDEVVGILADLEAVRRADEVLCSADRA